MKYIQIIFISFFVCSCTNLKYLENFDGFKGHPKEVEISFYEVNIKGGIVKEEFAFKTIHFYDSKGKKIKTLDQDSLGISTNLGWNYVYNKKEKTLEMTLLNLDSTINSQIKKTFNKFGLPITENYERVNKKISYDRRKRLRILIAKKNNGSFHEKSIKKYDEKWREIELISYDSLGNIKTRIEYNYDKNGNEIKSKWYNSQNELYQYYNSNFNNNNDRIEIKSYNITNGESTLEKTSKSDYKYDAKGNNIEEKQIVNGEITWIIRGKFKYY